MTTLLTQNKVSALGTITIDSKLKLPVLPGIVSEWAALLPLVCHLANYRMDYKTTGEVALLGHIFLSLFPKLGTFAGLRRLLRRESGYVDQASARGGATCTVWDVRWGSVFPCANGAAGDLVKNFLLLRGTKNSITMPEDLPAPRSDSKSVVEKRDSVQVTENTWNRASMIPQRSPNSFRRYQTLHILKLSRKPVKVSHTYFRLREILSYAILLILVGSIVVLGLCGAYGSMVQVICSLVSQIAAKNSVIERPIGYLECNEESDDACMLVAPHQNAQEWTLFTGERRVVDMMLNKPMIVVPDCKRNYFSALWFSVAHYLQILSMTFVAAQKGWDGVFFVILLVVDFMFSWHFRNTRMARAWLATENVATKSHTFYFGSRTIMLGAIEKGYGNGRTIWMDQIMPPHPRRDAWIKCIFEQKFDEDTLSESDVSWVKKSSALVALSVDIIKEIIGVDAV